IKENCSVEQKINISKNNKKVSDINLENDVKEKLIKEGKPKDLLKFLQCYNNYYYYKDEKDKKQNEKNCKEVANLLFKHIVENKDKKLCKRILLSTNENDTSERDMENIIDLLNAKELFKAYIDMCSEKEVKEFISELQSNKDMNDYPNQNESLYDLCGYGN
ncbi:MAG: hypothetical protein KBT30_00845, partial [Clostridiales bacterium]|nr:hypothetical protein [Candidatus Apopatousia equi]